MFYHILISHGYCQFFFLSFFLSFFFIFRAPLMAYGGLQARGQIGAAAASLCQSYSNTRFELHLQLIPQTHTAAGGNARSLIP